MEREEKTASYAQNWGAYSRAQCREKELFTELLADLCRKVEEPEQKIGRPRHRLSEMLFCSAFKVYSLFSGRRFTSDMKSARERGHISKVPHYNSVFNYLRKKELTPLLDGLITESSLPLASIESDFAADTSGFATSTYGRWYDHKYSGEGKYTRHRQWVKAHLMVGVKTNIVTAARLTKGTRYDSPEFPSLVDDTARNFAVREVSADKGYSSKANLECVRDVGGVPYIPFHKNVSGKPRGSLYWADMFRYFKANKEEFMRHYHKRSNVETVFAMIKGKFGPHVRSRDRTAQFNEVLCKILCHNICVLIQEMHEMGWVTNPFKETIGGDVNA